MRIPTVAITVIGLAALGAAPATAQDPPTLAAAGIGRVELAPDQAKIFLGVERVRPTSRAARAVVNRRIARVRRAIRARGIAAADIQTTGISVTRERVRARRGRPGRTRFHASSRLVVTTRDVPRLGALIDSVADAGADEVFGPDFSFQDPTMGDVLATRAAIADARRRADDAAAQIGQRVTGVQSVDLAPFTAGGGDEDSGGGSDDSASGDGGGTRVSPGLEEFVALVRVVYTIAPAT